MYTNPTSMATPVESRRHLRCQPEMINTLHGRWAVDKAAFAALGSVVQSLSCVISFRYVRKSRSCDQPAR